jgi:hypothetical protein
LARYGILDRSETRSATGGKSASDAVDNIARIA